jgi:hypothetical protein
LPEHIAEDMPGRMLKDMPDRMPEDLSVTKRINVMVGITRSKVILTCFPNLGSPAQVISHTSQEKLL